MKECPLTCFDGGMSELHRAHDAAFNWLLRRNLRSLKQTTTTFDFLCYYGIEDFEKVRYQYARGDYETMEDEMEGVNCDE